MFRNACFESKTKSNVKRKGKQDYVDKNLVFIALVWELDVDFVLFADIGDDGSFPPDDLWVIFCVHIYRQLETPENLKENKERIRAL